MIGNASAEGASPDAERSDASRGVRGSPPGRTTGGGGWADGTNRRADAAPQRAPGGAAPGPAAVVLALLLLAPAGCTDAGAQERIELGPGDLPPSAGVVATGDTWQSVAWSGDPWHSFRGETTLVISHSLGRAPTSVLVYLAFDENGGGPGLATGDMARIVEATADRVTIRNDTEADFFCRVVLE